MTPRVAESVMSRLRSVAPERKHFKADALAGLPGAISSVPDGMAAGRARRGQPGARPVRQLRRPDRRGLTGSTRLMVITTTSAAALAAGSAISGCRRADRAERPGAADGGGRARS